MTDRILGRDRGVFKLALEYVFKNFKKAAPSMQRNFFRQIFTKIELCNRNQLKLYWNIEPCGLGGEGFVLEKKWGGRGVSNPRMPESQSGALTTSPRPPQGLRMRANNTIFRDSVNNCFSFYYPMLR